FGRVMRKTENPARRHEFHDVVRGKRESAFSQSQENERLQLEFGGYGHEGRFAPFVPNASESVAVSAEKWVLEKLALAACESSMADASDCDTPFASAESCGGRMQ